MALPNNSTPRGEPDKDPQKPEVDAWETDKSEVSQRGLGGNQVIA